METVNLALRTTPGALREGDFAAPSYGGSLQRSGAKAAQAGRNLCKQVGPMSHESRVRALEAAARSTFSPRSALSSRGARAGARAGGASNEQNEPNEMGPTTPMKRVVGSFALWLSRACAKAVTEMLSSERNEVFVTKSQANAPTVSTMQAVFGVAS